MRLLPITLLAAVAGAAAATDSCDSLLFVFFQGDEKLYYAYSADGLHWSVMNSNKPVMNATIPNTSIRDPYIHAKPDGGYQMVSTNGHNFGGNPYILTWSTDDLINYSSEYMAEVMGPAFFPPPAQLKDTWAPEWVWDAERNQYFVFWAADGANLLPTNPTTGPCNNTDAGRFAFYGSRTSDFRAFSPPSVIFDPGCNVTGVGGIDGDIVQDENGLWTMVYKDARGSGEPVRGVRSAVSSTGRVEGPYLDSSISPLLAQTLVEAPEAVYFPDPATHAPRWLLYYDCSFMPTPAGWPRPPYGVSVSPSLAKPQWSEVPGACTGNSTLTAFPKGATHGSFLCISNATLSTLLDAFPL